jgi:hypothetical protein
MLETKFDLARVPYADGAAFDSYHDDLDARRHPATCVALLRQVKYWV